MIIFMRAMRAYEEGEGGGPKIGRSIREKVGKGGGGGGHPGFRGGRRGERPHAAGGGLEKMIIGAHSPPVRVPGQGLR